MQGGLSSSGNFNSYYYNGGNMTNYDLNFFYLVSYGADKFSCFLDVSFIQFSETVKHHDKLDEFYLGFVIHGTESQGSCQITI